MANFFNSPFSTFIRGAQTTIHEWQMLLQSLKQTLIAGIVIVLLLSGWQVYTKTTEYERYLMTRWAVAGVRVALHGPKTTLPFRDESGRQFTIYASKYIRSDIIKNVWSKAYNAGMIGVTIGSGLSSLIIIGVLLFFYTSGRRQGRDFHVRGAQLGTNGELVKALKTMGPKGTISLGGMRLPADMEPTNIAMIGAPRTGKSVQISAILAEIRKARQRAIVYDYGGLFTRYFYREGKDVILNPMDARTAMWQPWHDIEEPAHYEQQAASLIPDDRSSEDFWPKAARTVYVALARKLGSAPESKNIKRLLHWGLQADTETLTSFLSDTEAMSALGVDKTAASVRAHLAAYLKAFNYLRTEGDPFSIRKWVQDDDSDSWLFISTNEAQIDTVKPLISLWVDIAASAILSLPEDIHRRLWYVVDELTSMQAVPSLAKALTHAPKYGGCGVIGYQSKPILEKIYGEHAAAALSGGCAIQCIYRANDVETAEWAERALGQTEIAETNEGISYGVTELRDGRTASINRALRPLLLASEIRALEKFQYFLSMGSGLPIVPVQLAYRARKIIAPDYVPFDTHKLVIDEPMTKPIAGLTAPPKGQKGNKTCAHKTNEPSSPKLPLRDVSEASNISDATTPAAKTAAMSSSKGRRPHSVPSELNLKGGRAKKPPSIQAKWSANKKEKTSAQSSTKA